MRSNSLLLEAIFLMDRRFAPRNLTENLGAPDKPRGEGSGGLAQNSCQTVHEERYI